MILLILAAFRLITGVYLGTATIFYPKGDRWNPNPRLACYGRDLTNKDVVVAHPTLPCRSEVMIYNPRNRRSVIAKVGDRGPRHALVDLAPATAKALRANGKELVLMFSLRKKNDTRNR